jgi:hypothetical protein
MFNLLPKDEKFYDEMEALATHVLHASGELESIVDHFPDFDGSLGAIERDRLGSKAVFQESLLRLDKAFITPIDREDILNLITELPRCMEWLTASRNCPSASGSISCKTYSQPWSVRAKT